MFLIELLVPLNGSDGHALDRSAFERLKTELASRFGGVTAFLQAPAEGVWESPQSGTVEDRVVLFQVMVDDVDVQWWRSCRQELERELGQEEILVRSFYMTKV